MNLYQRLSEHHMLPSPEHPVVDFGCGNGKESKSFITNGYSAVLVDKDPLMLTKAMENVPAPVAGKYVSFLHQNVQDVVVDKASVIIISFVLPHFSKEQARNLIAKAHGVLAPDGVLSISLFTKKDAWYGEKHTMIFYDEHDVADLLKGYTYTITEQEEELKKIAGGTKMTRYFDIMITP